MRGVCNLGEIQGSNFSSIAVFGFNARIQDPLKQWKLSPMVLESRTRWEDYTKAKEVMLERTSIPEAPWRIVHAVDKKKALLNCISHLLSQLPYETVPHAPITLPARIHHPDYHRHDVPKEMWVTEVYGSPAETFTPIAKSKPRHLVSLG